MFTLQPNPTFKLDVTIPTPTGEGKIKFEFKHKGRKALAEFIKNLVPAETAEGAEPEEGRKDSEVLLEIVAGWEGVDQKFSPEALDTLLDNYPSAAKAIFDAYIPALTEGAAKNSGKSR